MQAAEPIAEQEIRKFLLRHIAQEDFRGGDALVLEELGLCQGESRIDIAVIEKCIHGYEIKSDRDTLDRLPRQTRYYNQCLTYVSLVTTRRHIDSLEGLFPEWWGVSCLERANGGLVLTRVRLPRANPGLAGQAIVQLLWRNEALDLARSVGAEAGLTKVPRERIWERLAETLNVADLLTEVTQRMRQRASWRTCTSRSTTNRGRAARSRA